ncbi:MAG: oxygenase MpaB family protein [Reichenbachiella sp.]|uniref:oxygenase MpaB family protein n=1 Tax=Reichenbachiella sp. TaxID=2184521 RepID=UPI00329A7E93
MKETFDISKITSPFLDQCRLQTDPIADNTIAKVIDSGFEQQINEIFMTIVQNHSFDRETFSSLGSELNNILFEYFESTCDLPEWADTDLILKGEGVFATYGPEVFMLLNVSSLPLCYTCAKGAQVLYDTGRLLTHKGDVDPLARRLMETAQMVLNVMSPGGLALGGQGIVTTQKVRLIHASIRYYLKNRRDGQSWNVQTFGEPINQEDLAGTLMSFAPVILSGLKQLKVELTPEQIHAYMHSWKVVGYLMGINEKLLPDTFDEGFELATKILKHQAAPSEAGKALTSSCIQFVNDMIPGNAFDELSGYLMHTFLQEYSDACGVDLAKCIGVDHEVGAVDHLVLKLTKLLAGTISFFERDNFVNEISKPFNKVLLEGIIKFYNSGQRTHFLIPPSLKKNWGVSEN